MPSKSNEGQRTIPSIQRLGSTLLLEKKNDKNRSTKNMLKKYACMTKWQIFLLDHFLSIQNSIWFKEGYDLSREYCMCC
jgi:hypothetical protein